MEKKLQKIYLTYYNLLITHTRFMASSLSNLVNNLSDGIHKINVNMDMLIKNVKDDIIINKSLMKN